MSDLRGRIKRLETKILPRYRACFHRWERLLARHHKAKVLQQRDPATWNGDEQHFMTHWQFFLDRHPKMALRLQNLPPAEQQPPNTLSAAPSTASSEAAPNPTSSIENRKSAIENADASSPRSESERGGEIRVGDGSNEGGIPRKSRRWQNLSQAPHAPAGKAERKEEEGLNRSHSAKSAHLPANSSPLREEGSLRGRDSNERVGEGTGEGSRSQSKIQNPKSKIETPYTYERDERGCWIKVPVVPPPLQATIDHQQSSIDNRSSGVPPLPPSAARECRERGTGGEGSRVPYAISRGAKEVPSVMLDVGADRPIHSNVVLPNLDDD